MASRPCAHPFVELWGSEFHCCDCRAAVTSPPERVERERALVERAKEEDRIAFSGVMDSRGNTLTPADAAAQASVERGVRIDWLV